MNVNNVMLASTAVSPSQFPRDGKPEIAFVGRSNVGKSSLINYLINRKAMARVSSAPGKTRVINFYDIENKLYFVDLPGYGYAKVSKKEKDLWAEIINQYFSQKRHLKLVIMLVDIRREPTALDKIMKQWVEESGLKLVIAVTKADKIAKSQIDKSIQDIRDCLKLREQEVVIPVSSQKKFGKEELWEAIEKNMELYI